MFHVAVSLSMKHGRAPVYVDGVGRRGERERRHEHLVARLHAQHQQRQVERRRAARQRHRARPSGERRQLGLERIELGPGRRHPTAVERPQQRLALVVADVGRAEEDAFGHGRNPVIEADGAGRRRLPVTAEPAGNDDDEPSEQGELGAALGDRLHLLDHRHHAAVHRRGSAPAAAPSTWVIRSCDLRSPDSTSAIRSSCIFSLRRSPVNTISSGGSCWSANRCATSRIFTGSPMSRISTSPGSPIAPACTISREASSIVMK